MSTFRFVHMADVHLDSPLASRSEPVRRALREALYKAFERAVDLAIERRADAVLIAGDLFDHTSLSFRTEREILTAFSRLRDAGIPVCYATGNHDPGDPVARAHRLPWPENVVRFFDATPRTVPIEREGCIVARVTGAGHPHASESRNLAAAFPQAQSDVPHVALLHTQVVTASGAERHQRYAPSTVADFEQKGFDYWALGHVHARQTVLSEPIATYPGNIQGRDPSETGEKGVLWVEIGPGRSVEVEFVPLAPIVWEAWDVPCPEDAESMDELVAAIAQVAGGPSSDGSGDMAIEGRIARIRLTGPSPLYAALSDPANIAEVAHMVCERLGFIEAEILVDGVTRPLALSELRAEPSVLSEALALCDALQGNPELLARLLPEPLAGTPDGRLTPEYARMLLAGFESELAARLVREDGA